MPDGDMVEQKQGPGPLLNGEAVRPPYSTTEARSLLAPQSLLAQAVDTQFLSPERFKDQEVGEVIDIKKIDETVAVLKRGQKGYFSEVFNSSGHKTTVNLDPSTIDLWKAFQASSMGYIAISKKVSQDFNPKKAFSDLGFTEKLANNLNEQWRNVAFSKYGATNEYMEKQQFATKKEHYVLPAGEWRMGILQVGSSPAKYEYVFNVEDSWFGIDPAAPSTRHKLTVNEDVGDFITKKRIDLPDGLILKSGENTLYFTDESGEETASFSGSDPVTDPVEPNKIYFINTGKVYSLDTSGIRNKSSRPLVEAQIKVENPQELEIDPNGNFLLIRSGDNKLYIVEKETGDVTKTIDEVKGPILVDHQGNILFADPSNELKELQTNFQAIPSGGSEQARQRREQQLKELQERFANLELGKVQRQTGTQISEQDVANTLRQTISRQVDEPLNTATTGEAIEDILDRLQGLKTDPTNQAYGEVVDEFISRARDKLSGIRTGEFDAQLTAYQKALEDVKSVGDTIGLDEQFAKLLELRQKIDITDPQTRREVEQRMRTLQTQKDTLTNQYQGELLEAANQTLPQLEQLIKETGSPQELAFFSTSSQAQQFEMMLANIKDPQVRKELRDKYTAVRTEQRTKLEEASRQLGEQERQRWAQVVDEAREDLTSLQEQIEQLSDSREIDRFGRHPLVTAWRAKLFALPPELREIEEKRLEIILGARRKDMEHRKDLGAVGEAGELKFGNATFSIYKEPPRLWQPKLVPRKSGFSQWADLVFEDSQGRVWKPEGGQEVVVSSDMSDERTQRIIERYRKEADEYFRGIKRKVPEFDEHWRITEFHMSKLEEIAEALNLQLVNHRGILILQGEAGTGKNVLIDMLANLSNREVTPILCNENSVKEDLTYEFYYDPEKGTYKLPSKMVEGIQAPGTIVLFDEINALKPGIAKMMNSLFDYRRRIYLPEGGKEREIITDPTVLFVGTMNPQNYAGVNRLSPEVKSRARVVDLDYPAFEEMRGGRTHYRSDEAEMLAAYMDTLGELNQREFRQVWDYVINQNATSGGDILVQGNPQLETDVRRVYDVIRVANRLRDMYEAYQVGDSNEPMDFPTSLREVTDIVMEMNHRQGVKPMIKRVIIPKIDDRRQKRLVEQTIDAVLP